MELLFQYCKSLLLPNYIKIIKLKLLKLGFFYFLIIKKISILLALYSTKYFEKVRRELISGYNKDYVINFGD